ncbi:MAG: hypothetical protein AAGC47_04670 [Bacteroidota bacterium]
MKSKILFTTIGIILMGFSALAQTGTNSKGKSMSTITNEQYFTLEDDSNNQVVDIEIEEGTETLKVYVIGHIRKGKMTVQLEDPNEEISGTFAIKSSDSNKKASGNMKKLFVDPIPGTWRLTIQCKNATGDLKIETKVID